MPFRITPERFNVTSHFLDRADADRIALHTVDGPVSYGALRRRCDRIANVLRGLGVGRADRVLIALPDGADFVATWYAVQKIGGITMEAHSHLPVGTYGYYLRYTRPALVVAGPDTVGPLRAAGARGMLVAGVAAGALADGEHHLETLVADAPDRMEAADTGPDDITIFKFTTGSTGAPKACMLPARAPLLSHRAYAEGVLGLRPDDVVLPVPKLFFGYARDLAALYPFGVGAAGIVFPQRSTADLIFRLIAEHRPTILVNVPTMMRAMLDHPDAGRQDLSCLRVCTSAGEPLPADLHRRWVDRFGVEVLDGIGSSEAYHIFASNRPGEARPGTLGRAVPGYRLRVLDHELRPLGPGRTGRLEITGDTCAVGYWESPESSARTFPRPGVVLSGDLAELDEDGYLSYRGRADDLIKVGGRWVAPVEIEQCVLAHPGVADCAVVGYQVDGLTLPRAYVVTRRAGLTADEVKAHVKARLAPYKYPRDVLFVDALPRTASGKLDRPALRDR